jgi:hypothetical protein
MTFAATRAVVSYPPPAVFGTMIRKPVTGPAAVVPPVLEPPVTPQPVAASAIAATATTARNAFKRPILSSSRH